MKTNNKSEFKVNVKLCVYLYSLVNVRHKFSTLNMLLGFIVSHCELLINGQYNFLRPDEEATDNNIDDGLRYL